VNPLAIEDPGMRRLPPTAAEDLLEVFTRRYEQDGIILTTNRALEDWGQVLGHTAVAGAILEPFLHHTEIIGLQGRSYCIYDRQQRGGSQPLQALTTEAKVSYL
jgi:DNA replication protein DnaC